MTFAESEQIRCKREADASQKAAKDTKPAGM